MTEVAASTFLPFLLSPGERPQPEMKGLIGTGSSFSHCTVGEWCMIRLKHHLVDQNATCETWILLCRQWACMLSNSVVSNSS